jgi:16S rRNA (uracil1498-N3)-methyltransferase
VERNRLASLAGFYADGQPVEVGAVTVLGDEAVHHARVRRLDVGDAVYVADGAGLQGVGSIERLTKRELGIAIAEIVRTPRPPRVDLLVPVADRDRMLWCAEKCAELGAASWAPVMWQRSRSVSPRGEGDAFRERVRSRMRSALIQSHAAWTPEVPDAEPSIDVVLNTLAAGGTRLVLEASGEPIGATSSVVSPSAGVPVTIAVGPEGGLEPEELESLRAAGFRAVSLGANVLRFETAAVAALAIVRSALGATTESSNG